jgi:hypothetical protein
MEDQPVHEMIAAFAVGCMDKANYIQVKDYLDAGGELPERELGEMQNIVSMIPVILDLEAPAPEIKDMVAKKLIGLKDEIKAKIISDKRRTAATFTRATSLTKTSIAPPPLSSLTFTTKSTRAFKQTTEISDEEIKKKLGIKGDILKQSRVYTQIKEQEKKEQIPVKEEPPRIVSPKTTREEPPRILTPKITREEPFAEEPQQEKTSSTNITGWISLLLTIILFTIIGYYVFTSIDSLQRQIDDLKGEITSMRNELSAANNFISNNNFLVEFFNYKDIITVSMFSMDPAEKATARVLLSFNEKQGLVQFNNAKALSNNQVYQIWVFSKGQAYSLGVFRPTSSEYLKITSFPFVPKEQIELFKITVETGTGAAAPSTNIYLSGSFDNRTLRGR